MQRKPLTGWLILLIVILGPITFSQASSAFIRLGRDYAPHFGTYPSLRTAFDVFRLLMGASVCVSIYTAWVLYRRREGSIGIAQIGLVVRAVLMVASSLSIPSMAGFPPDIREASYRQVLNGNFIVIIVTGIWYLYLLRSQKVREIYAA